MWRPPGAGSRSTVGEPMGRLLVDASVLIAMAEVGELTLLRNLAGTIHVTPTVAHEATRGSFPSTGALRQALRSPWIVVLNPEEAVRGVDAPELDAGETTLLRQAAPEDTLLMDDPEGRVVADALDLEYTGLLGFLVAAVDAGELPRERGQDVLDALARSAFRMSAELYAWARDRLEDH